MDWDVQIRKTIEKSKYFLPLFSSISVLKKGYIQKEFELAINTLEDIPEDQIFIIPIRLDECESPFEKLRKKHFQDMFPDWDKAIEKISKGIEV
jgi:hypothetical protein